MSIPNITRTNTIDEWRIQTNQSAGALNTLETGNYTKSNGILSITGNSSVIITANGTSLQVSNSALFQSNVTVGGDVSLGTQGSATGNLTTGGIVTILAPGNALQVANNATVNTDLQVTRTIYTGNVSANGNVNVGGNETVSGILRLPGSGNVLYVNTGVATIKTLSATDVNTVNADIDIATIAQADITQAEVSIGTIISGNVVSLTSNSSILNYSTVGNTSIAKADIVLANVTSVLNVQSASIKVRGTSSTDDALTISLGKATVQDVVIQGNLSVSGTYTQTGNSNIEIDTITLNSGTVTNRDASVVNQRVSGNNAVIKWSESDKGWKVSRGNTYSSLNDVLDSSYVLATVTSNSTSNVASASAVKASFDTAVIAGGYANSAYTSQNTTGIYANTAYLHANAAFRSQNTSGVYANAAFDMANTALQSGGIIAGGYANSAYLHANSAYISQNTTGTYSNTAYRHANSAYAFANTRFAAAGGTITGDVVINGNITVSGATSYVNTTNMLFADAILTLNSDWPSTSSPTENAGIEVQRGTSANTVLRWNETTDKWEFTNDGSFYGDIAGVYQVQAAGAYANAAYAMANTAYQSGGVTAGGYANSAYTHANSAYGQANTATTNAATADQKAVSAGVYANAAFSQANTSIAAGSYANSAFSTANSKVASITAGTGVTVGGTSTAPSVAIGQAVATSSNVQFLSIGVGTAASGTNGEIRAINNIVAYYTSDRKYKQNVQPIQDALTKVSHIGGKTFDWTDEYLAAHGGEDGYFVRKSDFGVIAQDVDEVFPLATRTKPDGSLVVDYEKLCALAFAAIVELKKEIDELKEKI